MRDRATRVKGRLVAAAAWSGARECVHVACGRALSCGVLTGSGAVAAAACVAAECAQSHPHGAARTEATAERRKGRVRSRVVCGWNWSGGTSALRIGELASRILVRLVRHPHASSPLNFPVNGFVRLPRSTSGCQSIPPFLPASHRAGTVIVGQL